jgi:hypothetical protein
VACLGGGTLTGFGADWTSFRGPNFGVHSAADLPVRWADESVVWKTELPGPGSSSPVHLNGRIYLTSYTGYGINRQEPGEQTELRRHVMCIDGRDGGILWQQTVEPESSEIEYTPWAVALHGFASGTPAVDDSGVYVFFGAGGLHAFGHDGTRRWSFDCGSRNHMFGSGTSPVLHDNLVIVNASPESGSLIAVDKSTGTEVWRQPGIEEAWNTPVLYRNADGGDELAVTIKGKILAFNPNDGSRLWSCDAIDDYICPSIVVQEGVVIALGGRGGQAVAVRSGGSGDVTASHKLWDLPRGSNVCSPVVHDGHLYWSKEQNGIVYCANIASGELLYEERLSPDSGLIYASPLLSGGNVYYVSRENGTFVVAADPKFALVAHNVISSDDSVFNASPVPYGDRLLLRSDTHLYSIGRSQ